MRKDLATVSGGGQPRIGYNLLALIDDLDRTFSGFNTTSAALVGAGDLGRRAAVGRVRAEYRRRFRCGRPGGRPRRRRPEGPRAERDLGYLPSKRTPARHYCRVGERCAACSGNGLWKGGVRAILNYSPVCLRAPGNVLVQNENMAVSVAVLSKLLMDQYSNAALDDEEETE